MLLHLVKTLNKEVPFPPCSEREQAVLALPREQISPWHDLPPASGSRAETATAFLLHFTSPQRPSLLVSDVTVPSSPSGCVALSGVPGSGQVACVGKRGIFDPGG